MSGSVEPHDAGGGPSPPGEPTEKEVSGGLSGLFIRKPTGTIMLMIGVLLVGVVAYLTLPIASLPDVSVATLQVTSQLPGADAQTNASAITTPLERQSARSPVLGR